MTGILTTLNSEYTDLTTSGNELYAKLNNTAEGGNEDKLVYLPDSLGRPLRKSEFKDILRKRLWNKDLCVVSKPSDIPGQSQIHISPYTEGYFPSGDIDMFSSLEMDNLKFPITGPEQDTTGSERILEIYRQYLHGEDDFVGPSEGASTTYSEITKLLESIEIQDIDLIPEDSYTNQIDLNPWVKRAAGRGVHVSADVEVWYSMEGETDSPIHIWNTMMSLFQYSELGELEYNSFVANIESNVQLDFVNGILFASPLSNKVGECIINKCKLIYGK